jgi:hypothetical protein
LWILYLADYLTVRYRIPRGRQPFGTVEMQQYYAVRKKDGKMEYMFDQPQAQTCVNSFFPHLGYAPCWYVRRKPVRRINVWSDLSSHGHPKTGLGKSFPTAVVLQTKPGFPEKTGECPLPEFLRRKKD